jgi:hypothetical protein
MQSFLNYQAAFEISRTGSGGRSSSSSIININLVALTAKSSIPDGVIGIFPLT